MDSQQQQFCLKWNSFGSNLATSFSNLFKSESLADVTLFCDGVTFRAHKLILAACSKHLSELFAATAASSPPQHNLLVILDGTSAANMAALLEFMYKGEVHVAQDALTSFLKAAECLQVKGLSIEHEKLAVAQSHVVQHQQQGASGDVTSGLESPPRKRRKMLSEELDSVSPAPLTPTSSSSHAPHQQPPPHQSSPSPSYSPAMSPYMHPHPYGRYEQRLPPSSTAGGAVPGSGGGARPLRSPNEVIQESIRASVLRDGSKQTGGQQQPHSPPGDGERTVTMRRGGALELTYRSPPSTNLPMQPGSDESAETRFDPDQATALICPESKSLDRCQDPGCPEDLRMKMEPTLQQDESPSSTGCGGGGGGGMNTSNGSLPTTTNYNEREQEMLAATNLWSTVAGKLCHKSGTVNTPDGKKLKCPFCERLYGYETNLRAHIRQRHQGIRVPCPFCSRTFTRNNTVRRHIAREHKHELSLKAFQQQAQAGAAAAAAAAAQAQGVQSSLDTLGGAPQSGQQQSQQQQPPPQQAQSIQP